MGSMNWLGFSLSPQDQLPQTSNHHHNSQSRLGYNSDEISGNEVVSGECFDLSSDHHSSAAAQIPPPFGILEAFSRNHSQDWNNMKDLGMNSSSPETNDNYKTATSSDLSMLMSNNVNQQQQTLDSHNNNQHQHQQQQPKLENFLGRHSSFSDHQQYTTAVAASEYVYPAIQIPSEDNTNTDGNGNRMMTNSNSNNGSSIGLSMIKTWLRNQPDSSRSDAVAPAVSSTTTTAAAAQSALSLSMSTGSQSLLTADSSSSDNNKTHSAAVTAVVPVDGAAAAVEAVPRKSIDTFGQRTSIYRGVTRHRWTGRYEAHLWDNSCRREGQTRKGRQVYLGGYDKEEKAARAYDLAALKYWGTTTTTNFPINNYEKEVEEMKHMTRQEYVASLRRKSSGFSRGASIYRGVTRHHQHGRWQARIGRVAGNKDLYLGTFSTQEEAAEAYDIAAIKFRGLNAVTNFDMNRYDVKSILESSTLPIGGAAKRLKDAEAAAAASITDNDTTTTAAISDALTSAYGAASSASWPTIAFAQPAPQPLMHYQPYASTGARVWCKQEVMDHQPEHHQGFQYHDLQMNNNNTHNFFQQNSVLHNLMGIDHGHQDSSGSNSVMYSGGSDSGGGGSYVNIGDHQQGSGGGFDQSNSSHVYEASAADMAYHRSLYNYMTQQQNLGLLKPSSAGNGTYENWVPTAVPTIAAAAPRSNHGMAVCHGTPTFTVWNDG